MSNIDMADLTSKMAQLQKQIDQFNRMQGLQAEPAQSPQSAVSNSTPTSTYPKTIRTDTVEDILASPQWRAELQAEFAVSDLGKKANAHAEILFAEFCEHATGKPSLLLNSIRKETAEMQKPKPAKPVAEAVSKPPTVTAKIADAKPSE